MERHRFGRGEYNYLNYPLPGIVASLRTVVYPQLVPIANRWSEVLGIDARYPAQHADYIERCHQDGQHKPTPLLLQNATGDYNCLHQDLYGEHVFPLQLAIHPSYLITVKTTSNGTDANLTCELLHGSEGNISTPIDACSSFIIEAGRH